MFDNFLIWEGDMEAAGVSACGMFTSTHLIVTAVCLVLVALAVYFSRKLDEKRLRLIVLFIAVVVSVLEGCKIAFNLINGGLTPNHWLPLTFCSFAIYSYWGIALGKGWVYKASKGFICGGGIIAGFTFLLIPMTSVATYPMLHFLSCYSMLYHTLMMYVGLTLAIRRLYNFSMRGYLEFLSFTAPACLVALAVNLIYGIFDDITRCNMMFLSDPHLLDEMFPFIGVIFRAAPPIYTIGVLSVYLTVPFFLPYGIVKLIGGIKTAKQNKAKEAIGYNEPPNRT